MGVTGWAFITLAMVNLIWLAFTIRVDRRIRRQITAKIQGERSRGP